VAPAVQAVVFRGGAAVLRGWGFGAAQ